MRVAPALEPAFQSYLDRWLAAEPEARLLRLFVPAAQRPEVAAVLVLIHELEATAFDLEQRPAEAKLGWWHEEIHCWQRGDARHPITRALAPLPAAGAASLLELPRAAATWFALEAVREYAQWRTFALRFAAAQAAAIGAVEQAKPAATVAAEIAAVGVLARALRRFPRLAADPRGLLPLEVLAGAGASRTEIAAAPDGSAALRVLALLARRSLEDGGCKRRGSDIVLARDYLARAWSERIAARPERFGSPRLEGGGLATVFGLWRFLRNSRHGR